MHDAAIIGTAPAGERDAMMPPRYICHRGSLADGSVTIRYRRRRRLGSATAVLCAEVSTSGPAPALSRQRPPRRRAPRAQLMMWRDDAARSMMREAYGLHDAAAGFRLAFADGALKLEPLTTSPIFAD